MDIEQTVDDALDRIHARADENARGFTSHAPMVIDALVALDRPERIEPFLEQYLDDFPAAGDAGPVAASSVDAWSSRIDRADHWGDVLEPALAELAPTFFAAATHGLIRVGHASRMLECSSTPSRRRELAHALAYWQASAASLPGDPGSAIDAGDPGSTTETPLDAADLIQRLEVVPTERRRWGLFTEGVTVLADHAPYTDSISRLHVPEAIDGDHISAITAAMLPAYFESPLLRIAYIHTITAPSALRLIATHTSPKTLRQLYAHGVQAVAALHAISKLPTDPPNDPEIQSLATDIEALKTRAADTLEEHVIKFTEACLREHEASQGPEFLLAAADAIRAHETRPSPPHE